MGQFDSRYGGGPSLNEMVHSISGPKWSWALSPARCRPFGCGGSEPLTSGRCWPRTPRNTTTWLAFPSRLGSKPATSFCWPRVLRLSIKNRPALPVLPRPTHDTGWGSMVTIEAKPAVGRWRATDCVVLLARAATHRKASGSPSFTVCALTARAVLPQDAFPRCPFTGTPFTAPFSRYRVRKNEWRRLRFCGRSSVPWHAVPQRYHQNKLLKWMMSGPTCITSSSSSRSNCWTVWHSPPMLTGVPEKPLTLSSGSCAAYSRALHP